MMRAVTALLFFGTLFSCQEREENSFKWLVGDWYRINDTDGQRTFEEWQISKDGTLSGIGFTLEKNDTVFLENLAIKKIDESLSLVVTGVHEKPTVFKLTVIEPNHLVCENSEIEFPKKLDYRRECKLKSV